MLRQAPTCAPTAVQRSVGGLRSRVCRPSLVPGQRSSRMLSETLANLSITSSSGATYHRRPGVPARVAQLPTFTGSDDSQGLPDIELGQQQQQHGPEPVQQQPHQHQQQHGSAVGAGSAAAAAAAHNKDGERLADTVAAEVQRKRFEVLYSTSSSHHLAGLPGASSSSSNTGRRQQRSASSRELSSPADDETLPMLAEDAAHPVQQQQQHRQQQLPPSGGAGRTSSSSSRHHQQQQQQQQHAAAALQPAAAPAAGAADAAAGPAMIGGGIPRSIFVLSMVSMALTSASCVFNTLLPIYMVTELKMTMRTMGMFEGMLEAFSYVVRMFSGVISDKMTSRKAAITAGFAMGAAAKFGMSGATTTLSLFVTKAIDRLGNGVQAAPRDALIGDLSPAASRSACFGFAQSMRKWGSFMGAGLAFALMKASNNNYRAIFLLAAGVSALSTVAFAFFVPSHPNTSSSSNKAAVPRSPTPEQQPLLAQQPKQAQLRLRQQQQQQPTRAGAAPEQQPSSQQQQQQASVWESVAQFARDVRSMGVDFYRTLSVIALYGLGHINESLLEARAIEVGFGKAESTLVVALLCFSVFLCAYPLGRLDDEHGHATTFGLGMAALVAGDLVLLTSSAWPPAVFVACAFWGVHWAVVQGPMLSAVVGLAPPHLKGTAFGIFYTMMAVVAVGANTMFGSVWHAHGATAAFGLSAAIIGVTMVLTPLLLPAAAKVGRKAAAAAAAAAPGGNDGGSAGGMALKPAAA